MPQRLTPLEVSLLALDTAHTPGHVGTVDIFDAGPDGFDYERLIALIRERIAFVPRYRQRVRDVPARLAARSGWTTRTSTSPSTSAARRCRDPARSNSSGSSSVGCWPGGSTARGRCGRCTWSRGWRTTGSRWSAKSHLTPGRRHRHRRHRSGAAGRRGRAARRAGRRGVDLASAAGAVAGGAGGRCAAGRALQDPVLAIAEPARHADRRARRRGGGRGGRRRGRWHVGSSWPGMRCAGGGRRPGRRWAGWCRSSGGSPRFSVLAGRSEGGPRRARPHDQRRRPGGDLRWPAVLAADPGRVGHRGRAR